MLTVQMTRQIKVLLCIVICDFFVSFYFLYDDNWNFLRFFTSSSFYGQCDV